MSTMTKEQRKRMAVKELTEHSYDHKRRDPDNCVACAHRENPPNVAGWLRVWIPAGETIPAKAFADEMRYALEENHAYLRAVLQDIEDFGLEVERP